MPLPSKKTLLREYPKWNRHMRRRLEVPIKIVYGEDFVQILERIAEETKTVKIKQSKSKLCGKHRRQCLGLRTRYSSRSRLRADQQSSDRDGSDSHGQGNISRLGKDEKGGESTRHTPNSSDDEDDDDQPSTSSKSKTKRLEIHLHKETMESPTNPKVSCTNPVESPQQVDNQVEGCSKGKQRKRKGQGGGHKKKHKSHDEDRSCQQKSKDKELSLKEKKPTSIEEAPPMPADKDEPCEQKSTLSSKELSLKEKKPTSIEEAPPMPADKDEPFEQKSTLSSKELSLKEKTSKKKKKKTTHAKKAPHMPHDKDEPCEGKSTLSDNELSLKEKASKKKKKKTTCVKKAPHKPHNEDESCEERSEHKDKELSLKKQIFKKKKTSSTEKAPHTPGDKDDLCEQKSERTDRDISLKELILKKKKTTRGKEAPHTPQDEDETSEERPTLGDKDLSLQKKTSKKKKLSNKEAPPKIKAVSPAEEVTEEDTSKISIKVKKGALHRRGSVSGHVQTTERSRESHLSVNDVVKRITAQKTKNLKTAVQTQDDEEAHSTSSDLKLQTMEVVMATSKKTLVVEDENKSSLTDDLGVDKEGTANKSTKVKRKNRKHKKRKVTNKKTNNTETKINDNLEPIESVDNKSGQFNKTEQKETPSSSCNEDLSEDRDNTSDHASITDDTPVEGTEQVTRDLEGSPEEKSLKIPVTEGEKSVQARADNSVTITVTKGEKSAKSPEETSLNSTWTDDKKFVKSPGKTPVKSPVDTSLKSSGETSVKSPREISVKSPGEISVKIPGKTPVKSLVDTSLKSSGETSVKSPREISVKSPGEISVKIPGKTPVKSPEDTSLKSSGEKLVKSPREISVKSPGEISVKIPGKTPVESPVDSSLKSSGETSVKSSEMAPEKSPGMTSVKSSEEMSVKDLGETLVKSPGEASVNSSSLDTEKLGKSPREKSVQTLEEKKVRNPVSDGSTLLEVVQKLHDQRAHDTKQQEETVTSAVSQAASSGPSDFKNQELASKAGDQPDCLEVQRGDLIDLDVINSEFETVQKIDVVKNDMKSDCEQHDDEKDGKHVDRQTVVAKSNPREQETKPATKNDADGDLNKNPNMDAKEQNQEAGKEVSKNTIQLKRPVHKRSLTSSRIPRLSVQRRLPTTSEGGPVSRHARVMNVTRRKGKGVARLSKSPQGQRSSKGSKSDKKCTGGICAKSTEGHDCVSVPQSGRDLEITSEAGEVDVVGIDREESEVTQTKKDLVMKDDTVVQNKISDKPNPLGTGAQNKNSDTPNPLDTGAQNKNSDTPNPLDTGAQNKNSDTPNPLDTGAQNKNSDTPNPLDTGAQNKNSDTPNPLDTGAQNKNSGTPNPLDIGVQNKDSDTPNPLDTGAQNKNSDTPNPLDTGAQNKNSDTPNPLDTGAQNKNSGTPNPLDTGVQNKNGDTPNPLDTGAQNKNSDTPNPLDTGAQNKNSGTPNPLDTGVQNKNGDTPNPLDTGAQNKNSDTPNPLDTGAQNKNGDTPNPLDTGAQNKNSDTPNPLDTGAQNKNSDTPNPLDTGAQNKNGGTPNPLDTGAQNKNGGTPNPLDTGAQNKNSGTPNPLDNGAQNKNGDTPNPLDTGVQNKNGDTPNPLDNGAQNKNGDTPNPLDTGVQNKNGDTPNPLDNGAQNKNGDTPNPLDTGVQNKNGDTPNPLDNGAQNKNGDTPNPLSVLSTSLEMNFDPKEPALNLLDLSLESSEGAYWRASNDSSSSSLMEEDAIRTNLEVLNAASSSSNDEDVGEPSTPGSKKDVFLVRQYNLKNSESGVSLFCEEVLPAVDSPSPSPDKQEGLANVESKEPGILSHMEDISIHLETRDVLPELMSPVSSHNSSLTPRRLSFEEGKREDLSRNLDEESMMKDRDALGEGLDQKDLKDCCILQSETEEYAKLLSNEGSKGEINDNKIAEESQDSRVGNNNDLDWHQDGVSVEYQDSGVQETDDSGWHPQDVFSGRKKVDGVPRSVFSPIEVTSTQDSTVLLSSQVDTSGGYEEEGQPVSPLKSAASHTKEDNLQSDVEEGQDQQEVASHPKIVSGLQGEGTYSANSKMENQLVTPSKFVIDVPSTDAAINNIKVSPTSLSPSVGNQSSPNQGENYNKGSFVDKDACERTPIPLSRVEAANDYAGNSLQKKRPRPASGMSGYVKKRRTARKKNVGGATVDAGSETQTSTEDERQNSDYMALPAAEEVMSAKHEDVPKRLPSGIPKPRLTARKHFPHPYPKDAQKLVSIQSSHLPSTSATTKSEADAGHPRLRDGSLRQKPPKVDRFQAGQSSKRQDTPKKRDIIQYGTRVEEVKDTRTSEKKEAPATTGSIKTFRNVAQPSAIKQALSEAGSSRIHEYELDLTQKAQTTKKQKPLNPAAPSIVKGKKDPVGPPIPEGKYPLGTLVWGKMKGFTWWPALIIHHYECMRRVAPPSDSRWVKWFGDGKFSLLRDENLAPLQEFESHFNPGYYKRVALYQKALFEITMVAAKRCKKEPYPAIPEAVSGGANPKTDGDKEAYRAACQDLLQWVKEGFLPAGPGALVPELEDRAIPDPPAPRSPSPEPTTSTARKPGSTPTKSPGKKAAVYEDHRDQRMEDIRKGNLQMTEMCIGCGELHIVCEHPLFEGGICEVCRVEVLEVGYLFDTDGYQSYCCVCAEGKEIVLCGQAGCGRSFCVDCLDLLVEPGESQRVVKQDPWCCYMCSPEPKHGLLVRHEDWNQRLLQFFQDDTVTDYPPLCSYPAVTLSERKPIRVLSLFDGIGTAMLVLKELGFVVECYYASEVNKDAITVASIRQEGNITHIGDVRELDTNKIKSLGHIDLLIGGSPCNDLSIVNPARKGLWDHDGSGVLYFEFVRIFHVLKEMHILNEGRPFFWLFENVTFMEHKAKMFISRFLECNPVMIDAKELSPAHRARYFWGNLPGMSRPSIAQEENSLELQDVLERNCNRQAQFSKVRTITTRSNSIKQKEKALPVMMDGQEDTLWCTEMERIFGFPEHYTDVANLNRTKRHQLLGQAWSVPVIKHLLTPLKDYFSCETHESSP